jgi:hypothetical protein
MGNLHLNLDDYVRVTQTAQEEIVGRYDGVDYTFPNDVPVDVHKAVATHIFGFGLPEMSDDPRVQDKTPCLQRLGWVSNSGERKAGLDTLRKSVKFEEIPPFPTVLRLRQMEENTGLLQQESASRVPSSPLMGGGAGSTQAGPTDPPKKAVKG